MGAKEHMYKAEEDMRITRISISLFRYCATVMEAFKEAWVTDRWGFSTIFAAYSESIIISKIKMCLRIKEQEGGQVF